MIPRKYQVLVEDLLLRYPAVVLLGPRQCGKTTLAQELGGEYFDLESEGGVARLDAQWESWMTGEKRLILDEVQESPEVLRRLRGTIDRDRKRNGRFLLLGSVSPALIREVSESLAGRVGILEMGPLALSEVGNSRLDAHWLYGGYPDGGILESAQFPDWQKNYLQALAYRDLPTWGLPAAPQTSLRLLRMLAALHGQVLNYSQIGQALGYDYKTIQSYVDFLQGAFLVRVLPAYFGNLRKRLVKSPRIYIRDSGLLHALLGVADEETLYAQPWLGQSWEGYLIEQMLTAWRFQRKQPEAYYFRSSDGYELDLVLDWGTERWAIEIKTTSNPRKQDLDRLQKIADWIGASRRILLCRVEEPFGDDSLLVTNPASWPIAAATMPKV